MSKIRFPQDRWKFEVPAVYSNKTPYWDQVAKEAILKRGVNAVLRRIVIFGEQIVKNLLKMAPSR